MRLMLAAAAALLAATPAFATDWVLATNRSSAVYIDRDSFETLPGGHIKIMAFYVSVRDIDGIAAMTIEQEYDCAAKRYRRLMMHAYRADGSSIGITDTPTDWRDGGGPTSQGTLLLNFVCAKKMLDPNRAGIGPDFPLEAARRELLNGEPK